MEKMEDVEGKVTPAPEFRPVYRNTIITGIPVYQYTSYSGKTGHNK